MPADLPPGIEIALGDLATTPWDQVDRFAPEAALHLAWIATPGTYLTSPENDEWLERSKAWFRRAHEAGVAHILGTGTCIEYAASTEPLNETTSALGPTFPYSQAKAALFEWLRTGGLGSSASWTWARVFYPYGPGEHRDRLCSSLIRQLREGRSLALKTPHSVKDYIYIDDVASAMCQIIEAGMHGAVNVGSGQGISIRALALHLARLLDADASLVQSAAELSRDSLPVVIADNQRLRSTGWTPRIDHEEGLLRLIDLNPAGKN